MLYDGGCVINIQPRCIPHQVDVQAGGKLIHAGWFVDQEDYRYQHEAFNAINTVITEDLFKLEVEQDLIFNIVTDNQNEFEEFLIDFWETSSLSDQTAERIKALIKDANSPVKIVLKVPIRMTMLRRV